MMIITISGNAGSGKDTVADLLAQKTGLKLIKSSLRIFAKEKDIDIMDFERDYTSDSDYWDRKIDEWQKEEVKKAGDCILASMLAALNIPQADLKVWLDADDEVRAERVCNRDGHDSQKVLDYLQERDQFFRQKTKRIYGIDFWHPKYYDLRIDTSHLTPKAIVDKIIKKLNELKKVDQKDQSH